MKNFLWEREEDIIKWGEDRNIIGANAQATFEGQQEKTRQEWEEWKRDYSKDDLGDIFVTLVMQCPFKGTTVSECVSCAFINDMECFGKNEYNLTIEDVDFNLDVMVNGLLDDPFDEFGVGYVVDALVVCAEIRGWTLEECIEVAWNDIKDRKGLMVHGMFIKQADLDSLKELGISYDPEEVRFKGVVFLKKHFEDVCNILQKLSLDCNAEGTYTSGYEIKTTGRI